jgi:TusA-related sulfurtransferase
MMKVEIDARGLSCPQPVILARDAINNGEFPIKVLVDSVASSENVKRAAMSANCKVQLEAVDDEYILIINQ